MSAIQQMYCTHCTHGSSALERRQGELAARMLGYSVRSSSLEGDALRQAYRQVERYISYHLPRDASGEEKLRSTADTAPKRLIFVPSAGAWQVIGQVYYRQRDTEGRPGSYFAHVLCRATDENSEPWTLLDALRLWMAPGWVTEDSADHPFVLSTIPDLDSMLESGNVYVDDRALLGFLRGDDRSCGARMPDRWRDLLPGRRVELLQTMLAGLVSIGTTRRQTLLVAVEPEVAALLFYGIGRLLPPGNLRASVSMSTFESSTDRLTTALAATTFCHPTTAEFRVEGLRGRGIALNTFSGSCNEQSGGAAYAESMIRRLLDEGPEAVDKHLATISAAGPERIEDLEKFANAEQSIARMFQSAAGSNDDPWRAEPALTDFARRLVRLRLAALNGAESTLGGLCGGKSQSVILELAGTAAPGSDADRALRFLLAKLPEDGVAPLVANPEIDDAWKTELLIARISTTGRTPAGCEWIWNGEDQQTLDPERQRSLASGVVGDLPTKAVVSLLSGLDIERRMVAAARLLDACDCGPERWSVFGEVVTRLDVASLIALWRSLGARFFEVPESVGGAMAARLQNILHTLHDQAGEFSARLEFLEAGRRWLTDPQDESRVTAWIDCREAMIELAGMNEASSGWRRMTAIRQFESAAQRMTEAAIEAMPISEVEDDRQGTLKQDRLQAIGRHLAGGAEFLPRSQWQNEAIWKKVGWRIEMGSWPTVPLRKLSRGSSERRQMWIAAAIAAGVLLGVLGVIGLSTVGTTDSESDRLVVERGEPQRPPDSQGVESVSGEKNASNERDGLSDGALSSESSANVSESPAAQSPGSRQSQGSENDSEHDQPQTVAIAAEEPLVPILGEFAAGVSAINELKPPAVAMIGLDVRGVGDDPLPDWILGKYVIGALVQEHSQTRAARYLDFPDLARNHEAELSDGVDKVLVQFRFSKKSADPVNKPGGIEAASFKWAEVLIDPAQRYDIRFVLSPEAVKDLEQLARTWE